MEALFAEGRVIDLILGLMAVEAVALIALRRYAGRGPRYADTLTFLLSGAALMLAVRAALTDAPWSIVALFLMAGGFGHLVDLALRWRRTDDHSRSQ